MLHETFDRQADCAVFVILFFDGRFGQFDFELARLIILEPDFDRVSVLQLKWFVWLQCRTVDDERVR